MILVVGNLTWDRLVEVDDLPRPNQDVGIRRVERFPGGAAANVAATLALLKENVALLSSVGDDEQGHAIVKDIARYGVDTSFIRYCKAPTSEFLVIMDRRGNRCFYLNPLEAAFQLKPSALRNMTFQNIDRAVFVGCNLDLAKHLVNLLEQQAAFFANMGFWISSRELKSNSLEFLHRMRCLFANLAEFKMLPNRISQHVTSRAFLEHSRQLVLTNGEKDALVYTPSRRTNVSPVRLRHVENTLGCGDAFMGAYIAGYINGLSPVKCCVMAHKCASHVAAIRCERSIALKTHFPLI